MSLALTDTVLAARDIALTDSDFRAIAEVAKRDYGLHIERAKKTLIQSRLSKRLRALGLSTFAEYCRQLADSGSGERAHFVSALTTNVTHFFREPHHFTQLETEILPPLAAAARAGRRVRLWSAGCSSGQEPYSVAASMLKVCPEAARLDIRILATDLDRQILARAQAARYPASECRLPSPDHERRVFGCLKKDADLLAVRPELTALVTFRELNLIGRWPMRGSFDVIFCRNVAIYFDKPTQARLWHRFEEILVEGGYLLIGHSERVAGPAAAKLVSAGITAYRKS